MIFFLNWNKIFFTKDHYINYTITQFWFFSLLLLFLNLLLLCFKPFFFLRINWTRVHLRYIYIFLCICKKRKKWTKKKEKSQIVFFFTVIFFFIFCVFSTFSFLNIWLKIHTIVLRSPILAKMFNKYHFFSSRLNIILIIIIYYYYYFVCFFFI